MSVITIATSLFTATLEDILKITRIISRNQSVEGCDFDPLRYFLVGDKIFPLKTWLTPPYPGKLAEQERVFNYRLSRARRVIENCFGILAATWRIFSTLIEASVVNAERYILAYIALHNYLRQTNNPSYCPNSFVECEDSTRDIRQGEWRKIVTERNGALANLPNVRGSRYKDDTVNMRCCLMRYLKREGRVDWYLVVFKFMYFLSESYKTMVRSMKCWLDLFLYCHAFGSEVVSESVIVELLQHHRLLGI